MKRLVVCTAVVASVFFAGCGGSESTPEPETNVPEQAAGLLNKPTGTAKDQIKQSKAKTTKANQDKIAKTKKQIQDIKPDLVVAVASGLDAKSASTVKNSKPQVKGNLRIWNGEEECRGEGDERLCKKNFVVACYTAGTVTDRQVIFADALPAKLACVNGTLPRPKQER